MPAPTTLPEKVWERHLVRSAPGEPDLLYIDLHLVHEVTSPQAFDGLRLSGRRVRRPELTVATEDHNVPTADIDQPIADPISARQVEVLRENAAEFGITLYPMGDPGQGIVHVIGPEQGRTLPGMTIVCGDSHTATHGAFGALAFGIGTSEVEHVLATQTLPQARPKWMAVDVEGELPAGVTAKDVILAVIGEIGTGGGIGHVIEYRGSTIRGLSMEGRMTVCNMSIEAGARAGLVAPDDTTFAYLDGPRPRAEGRRLGRRRVADVARAAQRRRRGVGPRGAHRRRDACARRSRGAPTPARSRRSTAPCPSPDDFADPTTRETVVAGARVHGPDRRHGDARHRRRHRVHRLVHEQPHRGPARRRRRARRPPRHRQAGDGRARQPRREGAGRGRGAATGSSPPPAPTGASRAARCAWR